MGLQDRLEKLCVNIQVHLNKLECRESSFFLVTYFKK